MRTILIFLSLFVINSVYATNLKEYQNGSSTYLEAPTDNDFIIRGQQLINCINNNQQIGSDAGVTHYCAGFIDGLYNSKKLLSQEMVTNRINKTVFYGNLTQKDRQDYAVKIFNYYKKGLADGKSNREILRNN